MNRVFSGYGYAQVPHNNVNPIRVVSTVFISSFPFNTDDDELDLFVYTNFRKRSKTQLDTRLPSTTRGIMWLVNHTRITIEGTGKHFVHT